MRTILVLIVVSFILVCQSSASMMISNGEVNYYDGHIDSMSIGGNSQLNIYGGYIDNIISHDTSNTNNSGGVIRVASIYDRSQFSMNYGVLEIAAFCQSSTAIINDGWVLFFRASETAHVDIYGGICDEISAVNDSRVDIRGGSIRSSIYTDSKALITLYGKEFSINNQAVNHDSYASDYDLVQSIWSDGFRDIPCYTGRIQGILHDGSSIDTTFYMIDYSYQGYGDIKFVVPEPATLALMGLGVMLMRRGKR